MGLDIGDIVPKEEKRIADFKGKTIAIDAYNTMYQFLAIIRQADGTPLMNREGELTSHISGLFYRSINLMEDGLKLIYVFDGKPHELKKRTLESRREVKEKAYEEWKSALEEGDIEHAKSKAQQTSRLTEKMVNSAKRLLELMGIPYVQAPSDGEAQAAYMAEKGFASIVASQDYDSLLFGAPALVRNLTITGRRKLPGKQAYVDIHPEYIELKRVLETNGISREGLVDLAILVGTDFNEGIKGIGPKKGLKLVKEFGNIEKIIEVKKYDIPNYQEIRDIFLKPSVTDDFKLKWSKPDIVGLRDFLIKDNDFSKDRVETTLSRLEKVKNESGQSSLDRWF